VRAGLVFAALIERMTGIVLPEREFSRLEELAVLRAEMLGLEDAAAYLRLLRREKDSKEWRYIMQQITIKESSLFRGPAQFRALCNDILPERIAADRKELKIWSAGCARGEEPATLAVVLAQCRAVDDIRVRIFATDVDREAMVQGKFGEFSERAVRRIPGDVLEKYFIHTNSTYRLKERYRSDIEFSYFNLVDLPFPRDWSDFDVIFLRNVLIYFRESVQTEVIQAVASSLAEGGYLFVGPSESLWSIDSGLSRCSFSSCFAYRRGAREELRREEHDDPTEFSGILLPGEEQGPQSISHSLPEDAVHSEPAESSDPGAAESSEVDVLRLIRDLVSKVAAGRFDLAEQMRMGVEADPVDARLQALEGIISRCEGKKAEAVRCFRASLYLDPGLYQVRYLLALSLRETGWEERAREEFESILKTLSTGGGAEIPEFAPLALPGRPALEKLCREALGSFSSSRMEFAGDRRNGES